MDERDGVVTVATGVIAASPDEKLRVAGATAQYRQKDRDLVAIRDVSFSVRSGEFVSIVGPSGCGKSTLLYALDGLLELSSGSIEIDGRRSEAPGQNRAMVFQQPCLLPWRSVVDNVTYGLELSRKVRRGNRKEDRATARDLIRLVGLEGFEAAFPSQLSGGMQQRANLARALALNPAVLLLDEPFASLDAQTREYMQDELLRIWSRSRTTAVFVTHQIEEAVYLSDRVLVFSKRPGRVIAEEACGFARPRDPSLREDEEFAGIVRRIRGIIRQEGEGRRDGPPSKE